jgi:hypothetical protein
MRPLASVIPIPQSRERNLVLSPLSREQSEIPRYAFSEITREASFARKRESTSSWAHVDPRLRGGDAVIFMPLGRLAAHGHAE